MRSQIKSIRRKIPFICTAVLLLSLILAAPVFADDTVPAEEPADIPPVSEAAPVEERPAQEDTPPVEIPETDEMTEELPPAQEILPEEEPASTQEAELILPEPVGAVVQESTDTTVTDLSENDLTLASADGEALDMASEHSADALAAPDPYFKVGTTYYRFFESSTGCDTYPGEEGSTCFDSEANPIQAAINYIDNNANAIPTDRKIYVETGTYNGDVAINGLNQNLSTLNGLIGVDTGAGNPDLTGNIAISDLLGGFTLSGFTITGGVSFFDMKGTITVEDVDISGSAGDGLSVTDSASPIVVKNVSSSSNSGNGATFDNDDSGVAYNLTINNSYFDDNDDGSHTVYGLDIQMLGKITMDGVSASRNDGNGIFIHSDFSALTIKNAVLAGNGDAFFMNPYFGLNAVTTKKAAITIDTLFAEGAQVTRDAVFIETAGSVTIRNAQVLNNINTGMTLNTITGTGFVKVYDSAFNSNGGTGLDIQSKGLVYLSSITASSNTIHGANIDNCQLDAGICTGIGTVTITSPSSAGVFGVNDFSSNGDAGLQVVSGKAISITNIIADGNGEVGIDLSNHYGSGGVTLKKNLPTNQYFTFYNSASSNTQHGIEVYSNGAVRIEYLLADENTLNGGLIDNTSSLQSPGIAILYSSFNANDEHGLEAYSKGTIALTNVSANGNDASPSYNGAALNTLNGTSGGVTIKGIQGYICQFNDNGSRGLSIYAHGTVTLTNVEANNNGLGTYIENHDIAATKNVTITNANFNGITANPGVEVYSKGTITLNTVTSNGNDTFGAVLNNTYGLGSVIIKFSEFNENSIGKTLTSLAVDSNKNITLYNVSASDNGFLGAELDNCQWDGLICQGTGSVSVKSGKGYYNTFSNNGSSGLIIESKGSVSLSNINASDNLGIGVYIQNSRDTTSGNVTISASSNMRNTFQNNASEGLNVRSQGTVNISFVDAFNNVLHGATITNNTAAIKTVIIKDSTFNHTLGTGLYVASNGAITLQGVDCSDNSIFTGTLSYAGGGIEDVLSGTYENDEWTFTATGSSGYDITLNSDFFDGYLELRDALLGTLIASGTAGGTGSITISDIGILAAGDYIIIVSSTDGSGGLYDLDLNNAGFFSHYSYYGADLDNSTGSGAVKILYSSKMGYGAKFENNTYSGIRINSIGAVSIARADSTHNGNTGMHLVNSSAAELPLTLNTVNIEGNPWHGLLVTSRGNISLTKVTSIGNIGYGASLDNSGALKARTVKVVSSTFSDNTAVSGEHGLMIDSFGAVTLTNVTAENPNGAHGVYIDNTYGLGNVTVNGSQNIFDNNGENGLFIESHGEISLTNFSASNNVGDGINIRNGYFGYDPKNVKINNTKNGAFNTLNNNDGSGASQGINVLTYGTITINKVEASGNGGANVLDNSVAPAFKKVTVTNSVFNDGTSAGLYIEAYGPISLNNIWASGNGLTGLNINNDNAPGQDVIVSNVTVTGNAGSGLFVDSAGYVSINKLYADGNTYYGVAIQNFDGVENVTVTNSSSHNNVKDGFNIYSHGAVTIKNTTALYNDNRGIYVYGNGVSTGVTLYNVHTAYNNTVSVTGFDSGIRLINVGVVNISLSSSMGNGAPGVNADGLYIQGDNVTSSVTLNKCVFMGNYGSGVELYNTVGDPTILNTLIFGNDVDGSGEDNLYVHNDP